MSKLVVPLDFCDQCAGQFQYDVATNRYGLHYLVRQCFCGNKAVDKRVWEDVAAAELTLRRLEAKLEICPHYLECELV